MYFAARAIILDSISFLNLQLINNIGLMDNLKSFFSKKVPIWLPVILIFIPLILLSISFLLIRIPLKREEY